MKFKSTPTTPGFSGDNDMSKPVITNSPSFKRIDAPGTWRLPTLLVIAAVCSAGRLELHGQSNDQQSASETTKAGTASTRETTKPVEEDLAAEILDMLVLGNSLSEERHGFRTERSEAIVGGLDQPARQLLEGGPHWWEGGHVEWTMKVDPVELNYVTVKLWGSDKGYDRGRLILFANGLQVGYRHESDHDLLNQMDDDALAPGRFVYVTVPLPPPLTKGKESIELKIVATGPIWFYGNNFEKYQKPFQGPSRGIYRVYTHTSTRFVPAASEIQGKMPAASIRATHGPEVIAKSKEVVVGRIQRALNNKDIPGNARGRNDELTLLSEAYHTSWTPAYQNRRTLDRILRIGDALAEQFSGDPKIIDDDWNGARPLGQAVTMTWPDLLDDLDGPITIGGKTMRRKDAWSAMLKYSVEHWRTHRRNYTNQSMIVDLGIHACNLALLQLDPSKALPESHTLRFLHESAGIEPWRGSDLPGGGSAMPHGADFRLITRKGLSRELGYVASYGETILPFMDEMVRLTGDAKLRGQARKMQLARHPFRYPSLDADGYRCMKLVSEIDNRTAHFPQAGSAYNSPVVREAWWMETAALLPDDLSIVGVARQSVEEGQYFSHINNRLRDPQTLGMMWNVSNWEKVSQLPDSPQRLPMTPGQPDFVFSDEENAVIALKQGETMLFVNLYYRAERAVNRVSRVFEITPEMVRLATVRTDVEVVESGETYTRPNWTDRIRNRGQNPPGQKLRQAWAGEVMPISKRPDDAKFPAYGEFGPFVGKAAFYSLRYGNYLIGLNTTEDRSYTLAVPPDVGEVTDLVTGKTAKSNGGINVAPLSTVVLDLGGRSKG